MAELVYFTGPMDCGKSTLALQLDYTHSAGGRKGRLFTSRDRAGAATISSRLGLARPAVEVDPGFDFWPYVVDRLTGGERVDYLIGDEAQFYTAAQVDQLARIVDELQIDVFAFGILTDFQTRLFPGSQRLVELCDKLEVLQVRALCWCGNRATHNARTVDGVMVTQGDQVMVGDTAAPGELAAVVAYEVLCRPHHRRRLTRAAAWATRLEPLPFGRGVSSEALVQADELAALLASDLPPVLADVPWTLAGGPAEADFLAAHLPRAQWVDLERDLSAPPGDGGRHPLPPPAVFTAAMQRIGVRGDRPVVAYDGATALAAARLWWLLTDAGHRDVRVLDGGLAAWRATGRPTETGRAVPVATGTFVARPGHRDAVTAEEIAAGLAAGTGPRLVDVRAAERFSGASEPIDPVAGHLPGAVNLPATGNQDAEGRFLPPAVLARRFAKAGVDTGAVLYCGSGITAAQSLLALESAGGSAALYPGSWSDWIRDPARPVATGST